MPLKSANLRTVVSRLLSSLERLTMRRSAASDASESVARAASTRWASSRKRCLSAAAGTLWRTPGFHTQVSTYGCGCTAIFCSSAVMAAFRAFSPARRSRRLDTSRCAASAARFVVTASSTLATTSSSSRFLSSISRERRSSQLVTTGSQASKASLSVLLERLSASWASSRRWISSTSSALGRRVLSNEPVCSRSSARRTFRSSRRAA
eukprot:scaffold503_cov375-Pinguiococcus_pyrenoidosus.AAC.13